MRRKVRGISETIAVAIMIAVAVVIGIMLYINSTKMIGGGETVQGAAYLIGNQYAGSNQFVTIGIRLTSKTDKPLTITGINMSVIYRSSTTPTAVNVPGGAGATTVPSLPVTLYPGATQEIQVTLSRTTTDPITSVNIAVTVTDASGNTRTVNIGQITVT